MRDHDDIVPMPGLDAEIIENFQKVIFFWMRRGFSEERAHASVSKAIKGYLQLVTIVFGYIPEELVKQYAATYLKVLVAEMDEIESHIGRA